MIYIFPVDIFSTPSTAAVGPPAPPPPSSSLLVDDDEAGGPRPSWPPPIISETVQHSLARRDRGSPMPPTLTGDNSSPSLSSLSASSALPVPHAVNADTAPTSSSETTPPITVTPAVVELMDLDRASSAHVNTTVSTIEPPARGSTSPSQASTSQAPSSAVSDTASHGPAIDSLGRSAFPSLDTDAPSSRMVPDDNTVSATVCSPSPPMTSILTTVAANPFEMDLSPLTYGPLNDGAAAFFASIGAVDSGDAEKTEPGNGSVSKDVVEEAVESAQEGNEKNAKGDSEDARPPSANRHRRLLQGQRAFV